MDLEEKKLNEEEEKSTDSADTQTATTSEPVETEPNPVETEPTDNSSVEEEETKTEETIAPTNEPTEKTFTQAEVNVLVGQARAEGRQSALNELIKTYGIEKVEDIGDIVEKSKQYNSLNDDYSRAQEELGKYRTNEILSNANIDPNQFDDIKYYMKGKGSDITEDSIQSELGTHPNWIKMAEGNDTDELTMDDIISQKVALELAKQQGQSVVTSSANESTSGDGLISDSDEELNEVRALYNTMR